MPRQRRGRADHLPLGRYAVQDPDDGGWTYWRVESTGRTSRELRPWPPDVRWAPDRPPYPEGLSRDERDEWRQAWYDDVYFVWKERVIAAIAEDPQAAASAFAEHSPHAVLPPEEERRPRRKPWSPPMPKPVSAAAKRRSEERILAAALKLAGLSYSQVAESLDLPRTTAIRRAVSGRQPTEVRDVVAQTMLALDISRMQERLSEVVLAAEAGKVSSAEAERIRLMVDRLEALRALVAADPLAGRHAFASRLLRSGGTHDR